MKLNRNIDKNDEYDEFTCITPTKVENNDEDE